MVYQTGPSIFTKRTLLFLIVHVSQDVSRCHIPPTVSARRRSRIEKEQRQLRTGHILLGLTGINGLCSGLYNGDIGDIANNMILSEDYSYYQFY